MIFLSSEDTRQVADWGAAVDCILSSYAAEIEPRSVPARVVAVASGRSMRCMPAISPTGRFMGTKHLVKSGNGNITFAIVLFDQEEGRLAYLVDGLHVTAMRTAATSAAALGLLSHDVELDLAVLGSGLEAATHVEAFAALRSIRSLAVYSPSAVNRAAFARRFDDELGIQVRIAGSAQDAVEGARHVLAAARSRDETPVLYSDWLAECALLVSIGSTLPSQRELDVGVIELAELIVADDPRELAEQTGDMLEATARGVDFERKLFSLQSLARGELADALRSRTGLRLFKSLGSGLQDIALAELLANRCREAGIGIQLPVALSVK
jgi:ornithine cyclodeaminase/alanine dehydrogenase